MVRSDEDGDLVVEGGYAASTYSGEDMRAAVEANPLISPHRAPVGERYRPDFQHSVCLDAEVIQQPWDRGELDRMSIVLNDDGIGVSLYIIRSMEHALQGGRTYLVDGLEHHHTSLRMLHRQHWQALLTLNQ